jgi:predicted aldo/keto reductase-like oxidoreductase|tara:strand:- start:3014 stop:3295 length:282 start_codon:yes stop_codon:yes gene_type:complete
MDKEELVESVLVNKEAIVAPRTPEKVHHEIQYMLKSGISYIDALCEYARINELEIETVADIVKKSSILKEKVRSEAVDAKLVVKDDQDLTKLC